MYARYFYFDYSSVSLKYIHPLVDEVVMPMQYSADPTPFWGMIHLHTMLSRILFNQWLRKWSFDVIFG
jgi:hypothetical protein